MPFTINDDDRKPAPNQEPVGGGGNISARSFNVSEDDKKDTQVSSQPTAGAPEGRGEVIPQNTKVYKDGDTYRAEYDGQLYNVVDAGGSLLLQSPSGTMAPQPVQAEFNNLVHRGDRGTRHVDTLDNVPEVDELQQAWARLSDEDRNSFLAKSPWVAGAASFLDNLLPVSLLWALPDKYESQVRNAMRENQDVTDKAAVAGTVIGLIGGPIGAAKIAKGGVKYLRKHATRKAGQRSAASLEKYASELKKVMDDAFKQGKFPPVNVKAFYDDVDDLLEDWGSYVFDEKLDVNQIRDFLGNRINGLAPSHTLRKFSDDGGDLFASYWGGRKPNAPRPSQGDVDYFRKAFKYRLAEISLNAVPEACQFISSIGADAYANYVYAYTSFKNQGLADKEVSKGAWLYMFDKTPTDAVAEAIGLFGDKGWGAVISLLAQLGIRIALVLPDLTDEGEIRPDVYDLKQKELAAGWQAESDKYAAQYSNRGGPAMSQRDRMRAKFYRMSGKPLPKLIR